MAASKRRARASLSSTASYTTPRLRLRGWRERDLAPFRRMNADARVMEHFPAVLAVEESDALARRFDAAMARRGYGLWAVETRADATFIGYVGLGYTEFDAPFTPCVEVGWRLAHAAWGQGYATEAARRALAVGFEDHGLAEIVSFTVPANTRSRAVMARLGMVRDARDDFLHPALPTGHPLGPHVLYRLTRAAWVAGRGSGLEPLGRKTL